LNPQTGKAADSFWPQLRALPDPDIIVAEIVEDLQAAILSRSRERLTKTLRPQHRTNKLDHKSSPQLNDSEPNNDPQNFRSKTTQSVSTRLVNQSSCMREGSWGWAIGNPRRLFCKSKSAVGFFRLKSH
jgi:hypothetical protein